MIAVYQGRRPAGAMTIVIGAEGEGASEYAGPAVILGNAFIAAPADSALTIDAGHPVTHAADLRGLAGAARSVSGPPEDGRSAAGGGWRPLLRAGDAVLVAVRELPARQVWVGVDTTAVATDPAFVIFWTDVFDWLAGGKGGWTAAEWTAGRLAARSPIRQADPRLEGGPGLYRDGTGTVAIAMPAVRPGPSPVSSSGLSRPGGPISGRIAEVVTPLAAWPLGLAIVLLVAGLRAMPRLTRP